mmetsp:Transcript_6846/g.15652  ORF Transcript_6846/g.15652 Transcript_6846/m.15652 type:complete len:88 (+) Transcript_6846:378-641(+)
MSPGQDEENRSTAPSTECPTRTAVWDGRRANAHWPGVGEKANTCPECGIEVQASNNVYLNELKRKHKKKMILFGESQCDKRKAGKKI